jgi:hypothetical protein
MVTVALTALSAGLTRLDRRLDGATERGGALSGARRPRPCSPERFALGGEQDPHRRRDDRADRRFWSAFPSLSEQIRPLRARSLTLTDDTERRFRAHHFGLPPGDVEGRRRGQARRRGRTEPRGAVSGNNADNGPAQCPGTPVPGALLRGVVVDVADERFRLRGGRVLWILSSSLPMFVSVSVGLPVLGRFEGGARRGASSSATRSRRRRRCCTGTCSGLPRCERSGLGDC